MNKPHIYKIKGTDKWQCTNPNATGSPSIDIGGAYLSWACAQDAAYSIRLNRRDTLVSRFIDGVMQASEIKQRLSL